MPGTIHEVCTWLISFVCHKLDENSRDKLSISVPKVQQDYQPVCSTAHPLPCLSDFSPLFCQEKTNLSFQRKQYCESTKAHMHQGTVLDPIRSRDALGHGCWSRSWEALPLTEKGIFNPLVVLNALSIRSEKHKTSRCQKATLFSDEQHHIQRRTRCTAQNVTRIVLRVPGSVSGPRTSRRGLAGARRGNGGALGHSPEQRPGPRGVRAAFPLPRGGPERAGRAGRPPEKRRPPEVPPPGSEVTPRTPSPSRQRRRSRARLAAARGAAGRDHGGRRGPHRHLRRCGRGVQPGTGWRGSAPPPLAFLSFLARLRRRAACRALRAGPGRAAIVRPPRRRAFPPRRRALRGAGRNGTARGRASGPARGDSGPGRAGSGGARGREWVRERGREAGRGRAPSLPLSSPRRHSRPARESGPFPAAAGSAAIVRSAGGAAAAPRGGGRSAASCCRGECRPPALPALLGLLVSGGDSFA